MSAEDYTQRQLDRGALEVFDLVELVRHFQRANGLEVDGKPGPLTLKALRPEPLPAEPEPSPLGLVASAAALQDYQAGRGEEGGNNSGAWIEFELMGKAYDGDTDDDGPWCAFAVSHWIRSACDFLDVVNPLATEKRPDGRHGLARRVWKLARQAGRPVDLKAEIAAPGDVICWSRGSKKWQGHVGLVCSVSPDGRDLVTWEGNTGPYPSRVARKVHKNFRANRRLLGVARLPMELVDN